MNQCKTQADCFRELARVMDMCDGTDVPILMAMKNTHHEMPISSIPTFLYPNQWSFAVAIVEDKPVFIGDTLYDSGGVARVIARMRTSTIAEIKDGHSGNYAFDISLASWNPPKKEPKIPEDYTLHDGGECPVHPDTIIKTMLRNGVISKEPHKAIDCLMQHYNASWDVVAYKVIKPATVMVELTREIAEILSHRVDVPNWDEVSEACRKALEEAK